MKKIEELLNIDLGRKMDTPKKLNRSAKDIPAEVIDNLEAGKFTAEMIRDLAGGQDGAGLFGQQRGGGYPIFYYRTCITIHGNWPEISRERIGGYKNVIQNGNGSVEIRYSAIDTGKIKEIIKGLRADRRRPWNYSENSNGRSFDLMEAVTRETLPAVRAKLEPIAREVAELKIYGYLNLYIAQTPWGQSYLVLSVHPLAVPADEVRATILALTGNTEEEQQAREAEKATKDAQDEAERKEASKRYDEERKAQEAAREAKRAELTPQIAHLTECNDVKRGILVKVSKPDAYRTDSRPEFIFIRYDGPGAFGRVKVSSARSEQFDLEGLQWKESRQRSAEDLKALTGFRLAEERKHVTPRLPKMITHQPSKAGRILAEF